MEIIEDFQNLKIFLSLWLIINASEYKKVKKDCFHSIRGPQNGNMVRLAISEVSEGPFLRLLPGTPVIQNLEETRARWEITIGKYPR